MFCMIFWRAKNCQRAFSLIETLIGGVIFATLSLAIYGAYSQLLVNVSHLKVKNTAIALAGEQFEIIRNVPYADVGVVNGVPNGIFVHQRTLERNGINFEVKTTVRNVDDPFDGVIGGSPNDLSPADNKLVVIEIDCINCTIPFNPIIYTTRIAPKNLESASTNGALFVRVFDGNGVPIQGAEVHLENNAANPPIEIDDVTDINGYLQLVDMPPGNEVYEITVTKDGYSTDQTFLRDGTNLNPTKPHASVVVQQVTQISFAIDLLGTLSFSTINPTCGVIPSIDFNLRGGKTIGTSPVIYKYDEDLTTSAAGSLNLSSVEWDTYSLNLLEAGYDLAGLNPLYPLSISPGATQNGQIVLVPKDPYSILVTVKDASSRLPLSTATVLLTEVGESEGETLTTGRGFLRQTDWSNGSGQGTMGNPAGYLSDSGTVDTTTLPGDITLLNTGGIYSSSATLTSSTFDTGSPSNFYQLVWEPTAQPVETGINPISFQLASANTNDEETVWSFIGPDGTNSTFYTLLDQNISGDHASRRYLRYKLFMETASSTLTPRISDIAFTYTSSCTPSGQVLFQDLEAVTPYEINVSKSGYVDYTGVVTTTAQWIESEVLLNQ